MDPNIGVAEVRPSEMEERVAKAICLASSLDVHGGTPEQWANVAECEWPDYVPEARSAIEATRKPTPVMSTAGKHTVKGCDSTFERDIAESAYRVMIDAALS